MNQYKLLTQIIVYAKLIIVIKLIIISFKFTKRKEVKMTLKKILRAIFWICWISIGLATGIVITQNMMDSNQSVLSYLLLLLASVNVLAVSKKKNILTEWARKIAIVGNVSILVYGLTRPNATNHSIVLSMIFFLTIYLFLPRLIRET
jgi:hypothetical protein